jgi:hypothetical protein
MTSCTMTDLRDAVAVLSSPALIRLVAEIDDNGAIPPRGLARTLPDLSAHQLRQTADEARALGILHVRPGAGLTLTVAGSELADVYDTIARWARRHAYPMEAASFTSRVQHTLGLLAERHLPATVAEVSGHPVGDQADADLDRPRDLLRRWLRAYPRAARQSESEPAA